MTACAVIATVGQYDLVSESEVEIVM